MALYPVARIVSLLVGSVACRHNYTTAWLTQPCDHTDFGSDAPTFNQRFLVGDQWWKPGGPVLMYTGNEANIEAFVESAGFQWVLAEELGALVIFAEQRFYGQSATQPGACGSPSSTPYRYLSTAAVLSDYAVLVDHLRQSWGVGESPVIAIGGSYGGMLAAWLRAKYPHLVDGALASSAPVVLGEEARPESVYDIVASNYACAADLSRAFEALLVTLDQGEFKNLAETFSLCEVPAKDQGPALVGLMQQAFMVFAQSNYPYAVGDLPGNPAAVACERFQKSTASGDVLIKALAAAASVSPVLDPARQPGSCVNLTAAAPSFEQTLPGLIPGPWTYQRCSDILIPYASSSKPTSQLFPSCERFEPNCWSLDRFAAWCQKALGAKVQPRSALQAFGGRRLPSQGLSKVVFTNGLLDPWSAGKITAADVPANAVDVVTFEMAGAAHHLELRAPNVADPPDVKAGRALQRKYVKRWIAEKGGKQTSLSAAELVMVQV